MSHPYQDRVIAEHKDLSFSIARLETFIDSPVFRNLEVEERALLVDQRHHMLMYSQALMRRIELWTD